MKSDKTGIKRRSFLKIGGLSSLGLGLSFPFFSKWGNTMETATSTSRIKWKIDSDGNTYCVPTGIKTDRVNDDKIVTAKVDGLWKKYPVREFDDEFHDWWVAEKSWYYDQLLALFSGEVNDIDIPNGGHHHPTLATYGRKFGRRGDSDFHLNIAVKGFTIIPKAENIDMINKEVDKVYDTGTLPEDLFKLRKEMYQDKSLWDKTRMGTLELYTGRPINSGDTEGNFGFSETKTFQNIMANPMAALSYMSLHSTDGTQSFFNGQANLIPHWNFKGFCWLISHHNPANTAYENAISAYINSAHCRYHGGTCDIATNLFLVCEEFNNTPDLDPEGRGRRVVPVSENNLYDIQSTTAMTTAKPAKNTKKLTRQEKIDLIRMLKISV